MYDMYGRGSSGWTISTRRNEEFEEDDVWSVFKERKDIDSISKVGNEISSYFSPRPLPSAAKMIPRPSNYINSSALEPKIVQQSAPVNVPDWSKIYGKQHFKTTSNSKNSAWLDHDHDHDDDGNGYGYGYGYDDDDDVDDGDVMLPPHEWIAKKLARSQISSFSVCEGVGRTLKGRDLSRVRNAVFKRTGFLE